MRTVVLDFETRSELDIRSCGADVLARHPSTDILCMGYWVLGESLELWLPWEPIPEFCRRPELYEFVAHNASFERVIWEHVGRVKYGFRPVRIHQWNCTAARCAALALPRALDKVAAVLKLKTQKDLVGKRVMMKLAKPRKPTKHNSDPWHKKDADYETLYNYCLSDVAVEVEVHRAVPGLTGYERKMWMLSERINDRGVPVDQSTIHSALRLLAKDTATQLARLRELTQGQIKTVKSPKFKDWLINRGLNIENVQAATVTALLEGELPETVRQVLTIRQQLGRSSTAKYQAMIERSDADSRVRGAHLYHGASTGRFTGAGVQFQNFPKGALENEEPVELAKEIDGMAELIQLEDPDSLRLFHADLTQTMSSMTRPMIKASEGKRLVVCDYNAIEARVGGWMVGEQWLLRAFVNGDDPYRAMASRIYGVPAAEVTSDQRFVGKTSVLGLQYGMGATKFDDTCAKYGQPLPEDMAQHVVDVYRSLNKRTVKWWYLVQAAAMRAVEENTVVHCPPVTFSMKQPNQYCRWLNCRLPSGRSIAYWDPAIKKERTKWGLRPVLWYWGIDSKTRQWVQERTWGGKLMENVDQGISRDIMCHGIQTTESAGYPVIFHVHDELVTETEPKPGMVEHVEKLMCILPDWARGLPIKAKGFDCDRYHK